MAIFISGLFATKCEVPSIKFTIPWIVDNGWIKILTSSNLILNKIEASIVSNTLFIIVAESIVIFLPILQLGWFNASLILIFLKALISLFQKGPPEAVIMIFLTLSLSWFSNTWKIALCSESIGITLVFFNLALFNKILPALTIDSLFAIAKTLVLPIAL